MNGTDKIKLFIGNSYDMRASEQHVTVDYLNSRFNYDPESGLLFYKTHRLPAKIGEKVGYVCKDGYVRAIIRGHQLLVHRVIQAMITGKWPEYVVDHLNHNRSDNRQCNLRSVTHSVNSHNPEESPVGVYRHRDKYKAAIKIKDEQKHLGVFSNEDEALIVYKLAKTLASEK